jgi:hypothetical protein
MQQSVRCGSSRQSTRPKGRGHEFRVTVHEGQIVDGHGLSYEIWDEFVRFNIAPIDTPPRAIHDRRLRLADGSRTSRSRSRSAALRAAAERVDRLAERGLDLLAQRAALPVSAWVLGGAGQWRKNKQVLPDFSKDPAGGLATVPAPTLGQTGSHRRYWGFGVDRLDVALFC